MTDVKVDHRTGFVYVKGVKIGRRVVRKGGVICIQVCDKNKHRAERRGSRTVEVPVKELAKAIDTA